VCKKTTDRTMSNPFPSQFFLVSLLHISKNSNISASNAPHHILCTCVLCIVFSSLMFTCRVVNPCSSHHITTRWIYKVICGALHGILLMMIRVLCRASQLETVSYTKPPEVHRKIVCPA